LSRVVNGAWLEWKSPRMLFCEEQVAITFALVRGFSLLHSSHIFSPSLPRLAVSCCGDVALLDEDQLIVFQYNYQNSCLLFKKSFPIERNEKIREISWAPPASSSSQLQGRSAATGYLCYCSDQMIEVRNSNFSLHCRVSFPQKAHITSLAWSLEQEEGLGFIYLTSTSAILRLSLDDNVLTTLTSLPISSVSLLTQSLDLLSCQRGAVTLSSISSQTVPQEVLVCPNSHTLRALSDCDQIFVITSEREVQIQPTLTTAPSSSAVLVRESAAGHGNKRSLLSIVEPFVPSTKPLISIVSSFSEEETLSKQTLEDQPTHNSRPSGPFPHALPESGLTLREILSVTTPQERNLTLPSSDNGVSIMDSLLSLSTLDEPSSTHPSQANLEASLLPSVELAPLLTIVTRTTNQSFQSLLSFPLSLPSSDDHRNGTAPTLLSRPDVLSSYLQKASSFGSPSRLWIAVSSSVASVVIIFLIPLTENRPSPSQVLPHQIYHLPPETRCKGLFIQPSPEGSDDLHLFILSGTPVETSLVSPLPPSSTISPRDSFIKFGRLLSPLS
jgi:hypothetical protein